MASMGVGRLDPNPLIRTINGAGYVNKTLQNILSTEGLSKVGVKAELQKRIVERIQLYVANNDIVRFERLKQMIENPHGTVRSSPTSAAASPASQPSYMTASNNYGGAYNMGGGMNGYRGYGNPRLEFKTSPYYEICEQIGEPIQCDTMQHNRHTVKIPVKLADHPILNRVVNDKKGWKVMVFCAAEGQGRQDIAFPHQSEIKVNGGEIKANLRGLKNKPGSTRPVDITEELRLAHNIPQYGNTVEMTYALTNKKFFLVLYVVKAVLVSDLVRRLEAGKRITERTVVDEMVSKSRDADIVATASVLSLKCPLSTLRIDLPCRSISCRHNQCFDATSYLLLQQQGPTWLCPVCNNPAPFETLAVDEYVKDILKKTSRSVDQVTIHPNGKWELNSKKENSSTSAPRLNGFASDSDEEIIEITRSGESIRTDTPRAYNTPLGAPSVSREQSASSGPPRAPSSGLGSSKSGKRPISAVIDLTSSGDEDEEPVARLPKRQFSGNGYRTPMSAPLYQPPPPPPSNGYAPRT